MSWPEQLPLVLSSVAVIVALLSVWEARRAWQQSNRPIVSAVVQTHETGNVATVYNLVVMNTGNRPAVRVRLFAKRDAINSCLSGQPDKRLLPGILGCFSAEAEIPLLVDSGRVTNSFGITSASESPSFWKYDSRLPIRITYSDLHGRKFKSRLVLVIKDTSAFAGGAWFSPPSKDDPPAV